MCTINYNLIIKDSDIMLEIKDKMVIKVSVAKPEITKDWAEDLISEHEYISMGFSSLTYNLVFTSKRIIIMNAKVITKKKKEFTSIPYSSISYYSIDTEGFLKNSTGLEIFVKDLGLLRIQFNSETDIKEIGKLIIDNMD